MLLLNYSNTDNIGFYRLLWRYVNIHEIGTEITIPNFISLISPLLFLYNVFILLPISFLQHLHALNTSSSPSVLRTTAYNSHSGLG